MSQHDAAVAEIQRQVAQVGPGETIRLAKRTSNLFRPRAAADRPGIDVTALDGVIDVDPAAGTAMVQGMTTYENLVDATLARGVLPLVVPQLRTITLGGAATGLGIEATSFRSGLPHESVLSMQILTGAGEVVTATPDGEHADLFHAFPNSYGSLGYALALEIEVERTAPYVRLRHLRFTDLDELAASVDALMTARQHDGEDIDFLDGVVFSSTEAYLTLGTWTQALPPGMDPSDYTGQQIYYRSIQQRDTDVLTVHDYLWRWDTDWFWCSRAFGAQHPLVRRVWPRHLLRSDVYWRIVAFENRHGYAAAWARRRGELPRERVVQDVEVPLGALADFLRWFDREVPISPIWLCPVRLRDRRAKAVPSAVGNDVDAGAPGGRPPWPLYPMMPGENYVNVGFWSTVPILPGRADGDVNRLIEGEVTRVGGHKSLYSDAFYDEESFAALYGGAAYQEVKRRYDPQGRLLPLYEKVVRAR